MKKKDGKTGEEGEKNLSLKYSTWEKSETLLCLNDIEAFHLVCAVQAKIIILEDFYRREAKNHPVTKPHIMNQIDALRNVLKKLK